MQGRVAVGVILCAVFLIRTCKNSSLVAGLILVSCKVSTRLLLHVLVIGLRRETAIGDAMACRALGAIAISFGSNKSAQQTSVQFVRILALGVAACRELASPSRVESRRRVISQAHHS